MRTEQEIRERLADKREKLEFVDGDAILDDSMGIPKVLKGDIAALEWVLEDND